MAQTTLHPADLHPADLHPTGPRADERDGAAPWVSDAGHHERARDLVPAAIALALLLGTLVAGALALRGMLDFGVWFLGAR